VVSDSGKCGVYAKFARFVVFAEISDNFDPTEWINTRIDLCSGTLLKNGPSIIKDRHFGSFLLERAELIRTLMKNVSPSQAVKISQYAMENAARIRDSELGRVLSADVVGRFGVPKVGRNERCPCGSGRKYKKCHGLFS
jgi:hypothetical protein